MTVRLANVLAAAVAIALGGALVIALVVGPAPAQADVFGPISLVSAGTVAGTSVSEQADHASDPAISGNGRYVAFDGSFGGRTGVFRRDLVTGEVAAVAIGDATLPSISEDGRYVSFTTTARLDEQNDTNAAPDVYVRDMEKPDVDPCPANWEEAAASREACAFTLVSAIDGGSQGLTYAYGSNRAFEEAHFGSVASGRSALSGDGRVVAFVTTASSNAANPGRPAPSGVAEPVETPALQVLVRNLDTKRTELASAIRDPSTGGARLDAAGQAEPVPLTPVGSLSYGAVFAGASAFPSPWAGASISADGSTVAWMGQQVGAQAATLASDLADQPTYTEPLWRRIGEGQGAPTRRVTGGSDPLAPACEASVETQLTAPATLADPCQGPFDASPARNSSVPGIWQSGAADDYLPRLSANGAIVAFAATAREIASGEELNVAEASNDLYVVDMGDGLTRVEATRRLTELAGGNESNKARVAPIVDLGISPDGSQVAFTTARTVFPLGSPSYVSAPAASVGTVELYDVDFANDTLTRVTRGFAGEPSEAPAGSAGMSQSPSFSADGNLLSFSSEADNLAYGDGNGAFDAFVVPRVRFQASPTPQLFSPAPPPPALDPLWSLGVTALSRRDGTVLLEVRVPGAGTLRAAAQAAVRVRVKAKAAGHRKTRGARARTVVRTRTVATRSAPAPAAGLVTTVLKLARAYSALAEARGGLSSSVSVSFAAPGHATLRQSVPVTFVRPARARSHKRRTRAFGHHPKRSGR
jgi:hypothetical protein